MTGVLRRPEVRGCFWIRLLMSNQHNKTHRQMERHVLLSRNPGFHATPTGGAGGHASLTSGECRPSRRGRTRLYRRGRCPVPRLRHLPVPLSPGLGDTGPCLPSQRGAQPSTGLCSQEEESSSWGQGSPGASHVTHTPWSLDPICSEDTGKNPASVCGAGGLARSGTLGHGDARREQEMSPPTPWQGRQLPWCRSFRNSTSGPERSQCLPLLRKHSPKPQQPWRPAPRASLRQ